MSYGKMDRIFFYKLHVATCIETILHVHVHDQ